MPTTDAIKSLIMGDTDVIQQEIAQNNEANKVNQPGQPESPVQNNIPPVVPGNGEPNQPEYVAPEGSAPPPVQIDKNPIPPDIDWGKVLAEKTGGKIKDWSELDGLLNKKEEPKAEVPVADFSTILAEKEEELFNYMQQKRLLDSVKDMSPEEKIKATLRIQNQDWSEQDVQEYFDDNYAFDKEGLSEEEVERQNRKRERALKADSRIAENFLNSLRNELVLPEIKQGLPPEYAEYENKVQEVAQLGEAFQAAVQSLNPVDKLTFSFEDKDMPGGKFVGEFQVDGSEFQAAKEKASNLFNYLEQRYFKEGKYDAQQLVEDILYLNNKEKLMQSHIRSAMGLAKKDVVASLKGYNDQVPAGSIQDDGREFVQRLVRGDI